MDMYKITALNQQGELIKYTVKLAEMYDVRRWMDETHHTNIEVRMFIPPSQQDRLFI